MNTEFSAKSEDTHFKVPDGIRLYTVPVEGNYVLGKELIHLKAGSRCYFSDQGQFLGTTLLEAIRARSEK